MRKTDRLSRIRSYFPHLNDGIVYLNHAATGPYSRPVQDAMQKYMLDRSSSNIENYPSLMVVIEETLHSIGRIINAPSEFLEFVPNTSYGLHVLVDGLEWNRGDRIAIPSCEFPANVYPFLQLKPKGVEIDFIGHSNGTFDLEDIEKVLTDRTRLLTISWVQFLSGFRSNLKAIGELCKEKGILFCVDAIQGMGALTLDVQEAGIDFLSTGGHKWLLATQGIGFIYMSKRVFERLNPMRGWLNGPVDWENLTAYKMDLHPDARRFRLGTLNGLGITALHASLNLYKEAEPAWCERHLLDITTYLRGKMGELGFDLYGHSDEAHASGISTFQHPHAELLFDELQKHSIQVALRNKMLRFSPGYYTSMSDIDHVISTITNVLSK